MFYTFTVEKMAGTSIQELRIEWQPGEVDRPEMIGEAVSGPQTEDGSGD
jgi:hypothetical protein